MESINVTYLTLEGHVELQKYRYVYFVLALTVYSMIICFNTVVIYVIYSNKDLHKPMYVFIAALLCNALVGTSSLYPKLMSDLLSEIRVVSFDACIIQGLCIYTYAEAEFVLLAAMAYDRYVSICNPLHYATVMKASTVKKLLFCCWIFPLCENSVGLVLMYQIKLCRFKINRIYCSNNAIVKLSCAETTVKDSYGLFVLCVTVFPPVTFILFTYIRILAVCSKKSKDFSRRALRTCLPHLVIFVSFSVTSCFEVINSRLESSVPQIVSMIMSVENLVISPLINPVIYGFKLKEILNKIKILIWRTKVIFCWSG